MKDLYYILGTNRDCTPGELQTAYQKLVRKLQPDEQEHDHFLESHLQEISEAYHVLSDPDRRRKYDKAYKKNFQRRLYFFRIKYLNMAVTLALVLFTGLFGWYVFKAMGGKAKQAIKAENITKPVPAILSKPARHKRKHNIIRPVVSKPAMVNTDSTTGHPAKPIVENPVNIPAAGQDDNSPAPAANFAYLQSNITGIIYLHQSVNYTSPVLAKIPNHTKVIILEKGPEFYKVAFNNQSGYVPKWAIANP